MRGIATEVQRQANARAFRERVMQDAAVPLETVLPAFDGTRGGGIGTLLKLLRPLREHAARPTDQGAA